MAPREMARGPQARAAIDLAKGRGLRFHGWMAPPPRNVALFVTCLVDLFRPTVGFAAVKLLEDAGCIVHVPGAQTCCGQPAYNSGASEDARAIARQVIAAFEGFEHVVVPSGSCGGMLRHHYPALLAEDPAWAARAEALAERAVELVAFLHDVLGVRSVASSFAGTLTYHDACSGLRELGIRAQPRALLTSIAGAELTELADPEVCCGFGGTFSVKYPRHLGRNGRAQGRVRDGDGRGDAARRRPRLPAQHRRPAAPRGLAPAGAPRGRGARRHDR